MITDSKIYSGGGTTILNIFTDDTLEKDSITVNRLIETCSESKESLSTLYRMFKKSVFAVAFSITSDYHLAEDCVAETFIRLTQVRNFNPAKGDGKGFIHKVARNVALEIRRSHKKDIDNVYVSNYGESDNTVETSIYLTQLLAELNDKQRQIVVMRCCSELSFKEIAKIMKCPESTVKSRYKKAISVLQEKAGADSEK
ncbi:MAG: sigma-70 family RNA polymerase sigma factor [Ruminococcus flavefaciens]|nr:sigma-70 family RNA polymerase sigma factor [Ruminococcus flavefaciens]MCM1230971.1 sigma-70 family RNA polymerase sigma factor [Ruminococcus flavefaciens]